MNPAYLLFLLLPLAFFSGWAVARGRGFRRSRTPPLSADYFRGLNYLLNEEQDKAIEVFLRLAEYDDDTIETHLALGNLFRRRGQVDRAIRVHQNLASRSNLENQTKSVALLELGEDYMRAGLLDRAETLFTDLVAMDVYAPSALRYLVGIYQHERDWHEAITHARRLQSVTDESQALSIAHFYCELAEQSRHNGALGEADELLDAAFEYEPDCVRAWIIRARMCVQHQQPADAVAAFERAVTCEPEYVPEILPEMRRAYAEADLTQQEERFLCDLLTHYNGISPVLVLADIYGARDGQRAAIEFLTEQLRKRPSVRGMMALLDATMERTSGDIHEDFLILRDLATQLLEGQAMYRCNHCGFSAKGHHWQCPSCKQWGSVRPIHGVANE